MAFVDAKYETDNDLVVSIRTDTDLTGLMGTPAAGGVDLNIHCIVNGNRSREFGIHPRGVTLSRTLGTAPDTFKKYKFLPALTLEALATTAFNVGATVTIGTIEWTVIDQVSESLN